MRLLHQLSDSSWPNPFRSDSQQSKRVRYRKNWQILSTLCCCNCTAGYKTDSSYSSDKARSNWQESQKKSSAVLSTSNGELKVVTSNETLTCPNEIARTSAVVLESPLPQLKTVIDAPKLYPPGRILHIVRKYPRQVDETRPHCRKETTVDSEVTNIAKSTSTVNIYNTRVKTRATMTTIDDEPTSLDQATSSSQDTKAKKTKFDPKRLQRLLSSRLVSLRLNSTSSSGSTQIAPVYQVIENDNKKFNELLISPRMLQDHMPNNLIKCMKAVLDEPAPKKPPRRSPSNDQFSENSTDPPNAPKLNRTNSKEKSATKTILVKETKLDSTTSRHHVILDNIRKVPIIKRYISQRQRRKQESIEKIENKPVSQSMNPQITSMASFEQEDKASRTIKPENIASASTDKMVYIPNAPLAKPESLSDLLNQLDDLDSIDNSHLKSSSSHISDKAAAKFPPSQVVQNAKITNSSSTTFMSSNKSSSTNSNTNELYYYDDSINLKGPLRLYGDASIEESEMTVGELNALIQKLSGNYSTGSTSTPRCRYYLSSSSSTTNNIVNKKSRKMTPGHDNQSMCFMTDEDEESGTGDGIVIPTESSSFFTSSFRSMNKKKSKDMIKYIVPEIQIEVEASPNQYSTATESDQEDDLLFNQTSVSIVSSTSTSGKSENDRIIMRVDNNKSSSNRDSKNSDESNYIYGLVDSNNNPSHNLNTLLPSSNTNESIMTNYLAMEKLLKPHTNDYILCFDTSSIINDQNSSINSTSDMMRFMMLDDEELLSSSHQIDQIMAVGSSHLPSENSDVEKCEIVSSSNQDLVKSVDKEIHDDDKKEKNQVTKPAMLVVDYPDSGIDTARTLSPQIFSK